ncbi:ABC transporter ATP-binding protein [Brenneria sp. 4F2]|nr:ABC transporter ATP-binding protein [Brenneria bubanii]
MSLILSNVSKFYGERQVVSNISLNIQQGEFISLLGPSGCGKTTTLQMIAGFVDVSHGKITLNGADITRAQPNTRGLGIVFQTYALFPHMTVEENILFGLQMRKVAADEQRRRVKRILDLVHLSGYERRYPRQLSGGQRQRVALARALVIEPPVLLLDEPLSNLDAKLREEMQFELRRIQRTVGTTTLMVTHDQNEAMSVSDRVVVMEQGHIVQVDQPYSIYEQPSSEFVSAFVGKTNLIPARVCNEGDAPRLAFARQQTLTLSHAVQFRAGVEVLFSLRPEKIHLVACDQGRLNGQMKERFFMGSHWLYHIETPLGDMQVMVANSAAPPYQPGDRLDLDWLDESVRLLPARDAQTEEVG